MVLGLRGLFDTFYTSVDLSDPRDVTIVHSSQYLIKRQN